MAEFHDGEVGDLKIASEYFEKACDANEPLGCSRLAKMHQDGIKLPMNEVLPQNAARAAEYYQRAIAMHQRSCDSGEPAACRILGSMQLCGMTGKVNPAGAESPLQRACDGNDPIGCAGLTLLPQRDIEPGSGPAMDEKIKKLKSEIRRNRVLSKSYQVAKNACLSGDDVGCGIVNWQLMFSPPPVPEPNGPFGSAAAIADKNEKLEDACLRNDRNNLDACRQVAMLYDLRNEANDSASYAWQQRERVEIFKPKCDHDQVAACIYAAGLEGLREDKKISRGELTALENGCNRGEVTSCVYLAECYRVGNGVAKDNEKFLELSRKTFPLLNRACNEEDESACSQLSQMYRDGSYGLEQSQTKQDQYEQRSKFLHERSRNEGNVLACLL
jgi:TPR repeat protein